MPETIVSDRDPRFTSLFWKAIWENIGMRLQFSSSFHPQTDGQSEIANSVVLDLLKSYISDQKTQWKRCLPLVEFSYNNTIHSSTGKAPFEIVEGAMKVPPLARRIRSWKPMNIPETWIRILPRRIDWALLRFDKARLRQKKEKEELSMRYYGPFQITEQINDISFRLKLPDTWKIHNVFHVNLWKTFGDVPDDGEPDEQPEVEANEEILVPAQVLAHKVTEKKRFSKQAHFVPVRKKIKSDHMVKLFMHNIFKYHGMPQSIVSDRDPRMTSLFWKALFENMGTTLKFSSLFHPQTDGQLEEANSTVLDLLKCYVSEHKATWERSLPLVEYAYNNTVHTSTGKVPFEIVEGGKKVPPILQTNDKIFEVDKYVQNTDEAYRKIKLALEKTQSKQKKATDRHRRELVFSLGDWVLLRFEKARLRKKKVKERLIPKLGMRYYGPFQVCNKISDVAYRLKLPEGWKIHNAFHVSLLRSFVGDVPKDLVPEEQPKVEELVKILVPELILVHKDRKVRGKVARRYLVKFKNFSSINAKWMEEAELVDSHQLLQLYLEAFQLQPTVTMNFIAAML
ncbi:hypothetical protein L7F22_036991 [Adiantum nelumboides]|nr:hypothetical protein [Adiantum nelumboides]